MSDQRQGREASETKLRDGIAGVAKICQKCGATRVDQQIGLEDSPEVYVERLVAVFREVKRVLRDDGTLWLNLGDSYANTGNDKQSDFSASSVGYGGVGRSAVGGQPGKKIPTGLKPKDLVGIPWRVAFALQNDGWYLRSDIIWHKANPMPASVRDRPTTAHEYLFLLSKKARYHYDALAIAEPAITKDNRRPYTSEGAWQMDGRPKEQRRGGQQRDNATPMRNKRSVWKIATQAFPGSHFAVFPEKLVTPCILAGTSEHGCCSACGAGWVRVTEKRFQPQGDVSLEKGIRGHAEQKPMDESNGWQGMPRGTTHTATTGWRPGCKCGAGELVPAVVLDLFMGSGTVGVVALRHGRSFVGIELNEAYAQMARERIMASLPVDEPLPLFDGLPQV